MPTNLFSAIFKVFQPSESHQQALKITALKAPSQFQNTWGAGKGEG